MQQCSMTQWQGFNIEPMGDVDGGNPSRTTDRLRHRPQVFGEDVDPAFFIGLAIHAGIDSGISAEGNINMLQRMIQHRPAKLDEPLTVRGEIQRDLSTPWPARCNRCLV